MAGDVVSRDLLERQLAAAREEVLRLETQLQAFRDRERRTGDIDDAAFRRVLELMDVGIQIIGFDWRYLYVNAASEKQQEPPNSELLGRTVTEVWPGIDQTDTFAQFRRSMEERVAISSQVEYTLPDGRHRYFRLHTQPINQGILVAHTDVTELMTAHEDIRRSEDLLNTIFNCSPDFMLLLDNDDRVVSVNRSASRRPVTELLGKNFLELLPEKQALEVNAAVASVKKTGQRATVTVPVRRTDGKTIVLQNIIVPVHRGGTMSGTLLSARDVTYQRQLEHDVGSLEQQFRRAQKMESIGRLAGGIAHDFNNVLTTIIGNAELLMDNPEMPSAARESAQDIFDVAQRASRLIQQLLAFSRQQVAENKPVNLASLLSDMVSMLQGMIGENVHLRLLLAESLDTVRIDRGHFEQVILNLVVNARDAMPDGGQVTIEARNVTLDKTFRASHLDARPGPYVMLSISDTGTGMDEETESMIFEPFFTTKEPGKGTGLGLSMVFGTIRQAGGMIDVRSQLGKGTRFEIYFPSIDERPDAVVGSSKRIVSCGSEVVMLVEDDTSVMRLVSRQLRHLGYSVLSANTAQQAIDIANEKNCAIDLLLADIVLPGMNGRQLADMLRATRPGMKVLYTSGYTEDIVWQAGIPKTGFHFISKPYSLDALGAKVRAVLDGRE